MAKLRRYPQDEAQPLQGYYFYCPGCKHAHLLSVNHATRDNWQFNGDVDAPIFAPSLRVFTGGYKRADGSIQPERTLCHCFIGGNVSVQPNGIPTGDQPGYINFLSDSADHDLRGVYPMLDFPETYITP